MKIQHLFKTVLLILILEVISINTVKSQEFSISGTCYNSIAGGIAFDGTNYLIGLTGNEISDSNITVQFFSPFGQLVGNRISLGETGSAPVVAFDGTNNLLIWSDRYVGFLDNGNDAGMTNMYGRFISPAGSFIGNKFTIVSGAYIKGSTSGDLHFNGSNYFYVYREDDGSGDIGLTYGQFISTTGTLVGSPIQISTDIVGDVDMAFDGTNYLVVFVINSQLVYGQIVNASGTLIGTNFSIDNSANDSDNPVSVTYGDSQYIVAFHDQAGSGSGWNLFSRFVSTSGIVDVNKLLIADSTEIPMIPTLAYDGTNFLTAWMSLKTKQIKGKLINTTGLPVSNEYVIFDSINGTMPVGGVASFADGNYLAACTRIDWSGDKSNTKSSNYGIYGLFLDQNLSINDNIDNTRLLNIFPNPASDIITINIDKVSNENMILNIYSGIGALVKSELLKQNQQQINISDLNNGIYMIEVKSKEWTGKHKLIIQR